MNAPFIIAQAAPTTGIGARPVIRLTKPQDNQAVTVRLDGTAQLDLSAIGSENITLVRVGERLVVLFDNQATVTVEPFFGQDGQPLQSLSVQLSGERVVDAAQFANLFPIIDDQSILPAAGDGGARNTGGQFGTFQVDAFSGRNGLDLLGGETLGNAGFGQGPQGNGLPTAQDITLGLDDDEIELAEGNLDGPGDDLTPSTVTGTLPVNFGPDGVGDLFFNVTSGPAAGLTSGGDPISYAVSADGRTITASTVNGTVFTIELGINADSSITYTVTLFQPLDHAGHDNPSTAEIIERAFEDNILLDFSFTIQDGNGDSATATLTLNLDDDTPVVTVEGATHGTVDEDGREPGGNPGDSYADTEAAGDAPGEEITVTGSLGLSWGADRFNDVADGGVSGTPANGDRAVVFADLGNAVLTAQQAAALISVAGANGSLDLASLTSGGEAITYTLSADGSILTATTVSGPVFTVSLSDTSDTSSYTFTLLGPLDHPQADTEDDLDLTFDFTAYDSDGDAVDGSFTVTIDDDGPEIGGPDDNTVDEDGLEPGNTGDSYQDQQDAFGEDVTVGGSLAIAWGADNGNTSQNGGVAGSPANGDRAVVFSTVPDGVLTLAQAAAILTVSTSDTLDLGALTSNGESLVFTLSGNGTVLTATTESGAPVFTVTYSDTDAGSYEFRLQGPLDHPEADSEDDLDFRFNYTAFDADGDSAQGSFYITIDDDAPVLAEVNRAATVDEDGLTGGNHDDSYQDGGDAAGNAITTGAVSLGIEWGADRGNSNLDGGFSGSQVNGDRSLVFSGVQSGQQFGDLTSGNLPVRVWVSADGTEIIGYRSQSGEPLTGAPDAATQVFRVTLSDDGDGSYTFDLIRPFDHEGANSEDDIDLTFAFAARDADGDAISGFFTVTVDDDAPESTGVVHSKSVYENELAAGTAFGASTDLNGDGGGNDTRYTGNLKNLVSFGADKPGTYVVETTDLAPELLALTSGGVPLTYRIGVDNMLIAEANGVEIFNFQVDPNTGQYSFRLKGPLDHIGEGDDASITLDMSSAVTARDFDGDTLALGGQIFITIHDDGPIATDSATPVSVSEDSANPVLSNMALGVKWGADNNNTANPTNIDRSIAFSTTAVALAGSTAISALTSNGAEVHFAYLDAAHTILVGYTGNTPPILGSDPSIVFIASLSDAGAGSYSFELRQPLDHPAPSGSNQHYIDLTFAYTASDADHDSDAGAFTVRVDAAGTVFSSSNGITIDYGALHSGVFVNLSDAAATYANQTVGPNAAEDRSAVSDPVVGHDQIGNAVVAYGSKADDVLVGGDEANRLYGNDGNDEIYGGAGNDNIEDGEGNDLVVGGAGDDTMKGGGGDDRFVWRTNEGSDSIWDTFGYDTLEISQFAGDGAVDMDLLGVIAGQNRLERHNSQDQVISTVTITGLEEIDITLQNGADDKVANDLLPYMRVVADLGDGADLWQTTTTTAEDDIDGGAGIDRVAYTNSSNSLGDPALNNLDVQINLGSATYAAAPGGPLAAETARFTYNSQTYTDHLHNFENAEGGTGNDLLVGSVGANQLVGNGGDDTLVGQGGNDDLQGGAGNDTVIWSIGDGSDVINGGTETGADTAIINGDGGNQIITITAGDNDLDPLNGVQDPITIAIDQDGDTFADATLSLSEIEDITFVLGGGADQVVVNSASFTGTSLAVSTIRADMGANDDTLDLHLLGDNHRVVSDGGSGDDTVRLGFAYPGADNIQAVRDEGGNILSVSITWPGANGGSVTHEFSNYEHFQFTDGTRTVDELFNAPPQTNDVTASTTEDVANILVNFSATDSDGRPLSYQILTLPENATLYYNGNPVAAGDLISTPYIEFRPNPDWSGTTSFTYAARDYLGLQDTTPAMITIDVAPVADSAMIEVGATGGAEDTTFALPITLTIDDFDGSEVVTKLVIQGLPAGAQLSMGALDPADATLWIITDPDPAALAQLKMTPPADFNGAIHLDITANIRDSAVLSTGETHIEYTSFTQAHLNVTPVFDPAVIGDPDVADVTEDVGVTAGNLVAAGTIPISDADGAGQDGFYTATPVGTPLGSLVLLPNGSYTYSVANSAVQFLRDGETHVDTFEVQSNDGTRKNVSFTIHGADDIAIISAPPAGGWTEGFEAGAGAWSRLGNVQGDTGTHTEGTRSILLTGDVTDDTTSEASDAQIEAALGLPSHALDSTFGRDAYSGAATATQLTLAAGTYTLSFDWKFEAGDVEFPGFVDFAFFSLNGTAHLLTDISAVGDYGVAGWSTYTLTFSTTGTTKLGFGLMNAGDDQFDSSLWIDNVRISGALPTDSVNLAEDGQLTASGRLLVADADHDESFAAVAGGLSSNGYGSYTIAADGTWTYALNNSHASVQGLKTGQTLTDTFTFTSQDGSASRTITITIQGKDDAPVITGTDTGAVTEDGTLTASGQLTVTDADNGESGVQALIEPKATMYGSWTITSAGLWSYTLDDTLLTIQELAAGQQILDVFNVGTLDGTGKLVFITITGANDAPTVTAVNGNASENGNPVSILLGGDDIDNDDAPGTLTYQIVTGPAAGSASISGQSLIYNPGANFQNLALGETTQVTVTYRAVDRHGAASTPDTVTITVTGTNDAPEISFATGNDRGAVTEDVTGTVSGQLTASDVDHGAALTWSVLNGAGSYGTLTVDQTGKWTYVLDPAAANQLNVSDHPVETFTVEVRDQHGAVDQQTVTVTVNGSNDAPVALGESYRVNHDGTLMILGPGLLANDSDPDSASLGVQLVSGVSHGSLGLNPDGSFVYAPTAGYTGGDSFSYRVTDGSATSDVVTVAIHVNDPPRLDLDANDDHAPGTGYVTTYAERGPAVAIVDDDVRLSDSDDSDLARVTVTLTNPQAGDHLVINGTLPAGITAVFDGSRIIFSGAASTAAYESALKQITFTNSEGSIGLEDRTVTIVANDGLANSDVAITAILVTPYDDPPVVTRLLENDNVRENQGFQVVATFTVNDVDTTSGLNFSILNNHFPWYQVQAASGTVFGHPGNYEILAQGHFVYANENADGNPTVSEVLRISDGHSTIEVPFTFTVTHATALPQTATDTVITNAAAGQLIAIPDEVLLRNDTDVDSTLSIRNASGDVFGGDVIYTLPGSFPGSPFWTDYSAFDGSWNVPTLVIVNGTTGPVINGTNNKDILVADVPSQSVGDLTMSPYGNPFVFGEGQLVNEYVGQTFVASGGIAHNVQFGLDHVSGGDVQFRVMIAAVDDAADPDPTQVLFTSELLTLAAGSGPTAFDVLLNGLQLEAGRTYALILDAYSPDGTQGVASVLSNENHYASGVFLSLNPDGGAQAEHFNADWTSTSGWDMAFRITSTATEPTGSTLNGGVWDDSLIGDIGNDILNGERDNDWLFGRDGNDTLNGGTGDDRLIGGRGDDQLSGGTGADSFELDMSGQGLDHILDFTRAEGDVITLDAESFGLTSGASAGSIFGSSGDATFNYATGEKLHFDTSTDTLWYDGDGAAGAAAIALARLENGVDLQASDLRLA